MMIFRTLLFFLPFWFKRSHALFILVGPTGAGKNALSDRMLQRFPRLGRVVTTTTRPAKHRGGNMEVDGFDYNFVTKLQFRWLLCTGGLVEHAKIHGSFYGLSWKSLFLALWRGVAIADMDWQGALAVKHSYPNVVPIVIRTENVDTLRGRILKREPTLSELELKLRLRNALEELRHIDARPEDFPLSVWNEQNQIERADAELSAMLLGFEPDLGRVINIAANRPEPEALKRRAQ